MVRLWEVFSIAIVISLAIANAACTGAAAVSAGTVMATDKTLVDHTVSFFSGKDCAMIRKNAGLTYCKEDEVVAVQPQHCYRTLADVTCYTKEDPYNGRHQAVPHAVETVEPSQSAAVTSG
jgi:hypothetical protein